MKTDLLIAMLNTSMTTVGVKFKNENGEPVGREYTYKTDMELSEGDSVVVDSPYSGLSVCIVTRVDDIADLDEKATFSYKWIVAKVDLEEHAKRLEREEDLKKEFKIMQAKVRKFKMVNELKKAMGYGEDESCEELDSLIAKINES